MGREIFLAARVGANIAAVTVVYGFEYYESSVALYVCLKKYCKVFQLRTLNFHNFKRNKYFMILKKAN